MNHPTGEMVQQHIVLRRRGEIAETNLYLARRRMDLPKSKETETYGEGKN